MTDLSRIYRKVVASLCVGLAETINKLGPDFLEGSTLNILSLMIPLIIDPHS